MERGQSRSCHTCLRQLGMAGPFRRLWAAFHTMLRQAFASIMEP